MGKSKHPKVIKHSTHVREMCFGVREGLTRGTTVEEAKMHVSKEKNIPISEIIDHAETPADMKERQLIFLQMLFDDLPPHEDDIPRVLVVSHGGFIRSFLRNFCVTDVDTIKNCSISKITVEKIAGNDYVFQANVDELNYIY